MKTHLGLSVALVAVALVRPLPAHACSAPLCDAPTLALPLESAVPADCPGFLAFRGGGEDELVARLYEEIDGVRIEHPVTMTGNLIAPDEPLAEGRSYTLEVEQPCGAEMITASVTIEATASAPLPTSLGVLHVESTGLGSVPAPTINGSCYDDLNAVYADVAVELDPETAPWADALVWETVVDGASYAPTGSIRRSGWGLPPEADGEPGGSWRGRGIDRIYAACEVPEGGTSAEGVAEGTHQVFLRARIPGTDVLLETEPVSVTLDCASTGAGASGCSVSDGEQRSGGASVALVLAVGALLVRRARRR